MEYKNLKENKNRYSSSTGKSEFYLKNNRTLFSEENSPAQKYFSDNRSQSVIQKKLVDGIANARSERKPIQLKENNSGLQNALKSNGKNSALLQFMKPMFNLNLKGSSATDPIFKRSVMLGDILDHFERIDDESVQSKVNNIKMQLMLAKNVNVDAIVRDSALKNAIQSSIELVRDARDRKLISDDIPTQLFAMISNASEA